MNRYSYKELLNAAIASNGAEKDCKALAEWFQEYGATYWNGEYFDADGHELRPIYEETGDGEVEIVSWELR